MQKLHVRNIFTLVVPWHSKEAPSIDVHTASANFGFTLKYPSDLQSYHYRIALFSNYRTISGLKKKEEAFTALLQWAKQTPFSFKKSAKDAPIEAIELHLRIGPGFDFRKVPKRYVRFEIECFASGTFQCKASSKVCQILGKRRTAHASDIEAVAIPVVWQAPTNLGNSDFDIDVEELLQSFSNNEESPPPSEQLHHAVLESEPSSTHDEREHVLELFEVPTESPQVHGQRVQFSNDELVCYEHENEQYMVLYNGNAEVVGNFRALNFYKASDINIKEDVRLLVEDNNPRDVLLKISGVSYKFKPGTTHSTQRRFVGYIAQQIESVVPEAVQLIDGILHVDYESLIPYLSESIKQNYSDINDTKSEQQRINAIVDVLYNDFLKRERAEKQSTSKRDSSSIRTTTNTWRRVSIAALGFLLVVSAVLVGLYVMTGRNDTPSPSPVVSPSSSPTAPEGIMPTAPHPDRQALEDLYVATNGDHWQLPRFETERWLTNTSPCTWSGVRCSSNRVTGISLGGYNLRGTIPDTIGNLDALVVLDLCENNITGTIPESIGQLQNLQRLYICTTNITGPIPASIEQMRNLTNLNLDSNPKLSGSIPNLPTSLTRIDMDACNLTGTIPQSVSRMDSLLGLSMESNHLTGTIPPLPIGGVERLDINLSDNQLEGTLPVFINRSGLFETSLRLTASNNYLSGTLENLAGAHIKIKILLLKNNNFSGEVVHFDTSTAYQLDVSDNQFTSFNSSAPQPQYAGISSKSFYICDASGNPFRCPIPDWLEQLCSAQCIKA